MILRKARPSPHDPPRPGRLFLVDLLREAWWSVNRNLGRTVTAALGATLGCAAFVATLGLTGTVGHQISTSFDIRRATEVTVSTASTISTQDIDSLTPAWFTPSALERARTISGIVHAGRITTLSSIAVRRLFVQPDAPDNADIFAVDTEALAAISPHVTSGRIFDNGHLTRGDPVCMLSKTVAQRLGVASAGTTIFIGDSAISVIGIYSDVSRVPDAAAAILLPISYEKANPIAAGQTPANEVFVETLPGAAAQVGRQIPLALAPDQPASLVVTAPPDPTTLRLEVEGSVTLLSLLVSLMILVIGAVSIGNTTAIGVVLRTSEIGLRRALGARRRDIFLQILTETSALGLLGGLFGSALGTLAVIVVALIQHWVPVLDPLVAASSIGAGTVSGLAAGLVPAFRATAISPALALTR
ncbi:macrolide export ATP-binding/permease protein MacB 2 (plasmid) [Arthrobacter sp. Hiyo8]|uniref:ABC transporter permease n=1 Tax=Arthrobacter sp. Hiyo1 TaxID=1588020 RepID=UPI000683A64E|nr:ABC transporter permease [Arthrobacter sp. Hiyo1]BAS18396.1 macrolide export ATP-binding/permease protein MacB 2 [Arthrobacter sp. Hiyo8]GAP61467.1 macrolide export ATP-binding/permease protein MacB 2 [Arthrobacter sp. Hiyo1]